MQYLLTKEEYDALRNAALVERRNILAEVLAALGEEMIKVTFHEDRFGAAGPVVRISDLRAAVDKVRNRFQ